LNNLNTKLLFLVLLGQVLSFNSFAKELKDSLLQHLFFNDNKLVTILSFPQTFYIQSFDLMSLNTKHSTTSSYLPWHETTLFIMFENSYLDKELYFELSNTLLDNGYTVILIRKSFKDIDFDNIVKDNNLETITNVIQELKQTTNIERLNHVNFQKIATMTNVINSKNNVMISLDIYDITKQASYIIIPEVSLLIEFDILKRQAILAHSNNKMVTNDNKQLIKQIIYWCDFNLKNSAVNIIKTTDGFWQKPIFIKLPNKPWPQIKFPFASNHFVHCTQGNATTWPHSHFYFRVLFSLDLASPLKSPPGQIYAGINGTAYIKNNCLERINDPYTFNSSNCNFGLGNVVRILSKKKDYYVLYAHLSEIYVKDKQYVNEGDIIGLEGVSGAAGKRHLHWGLYKLNNIEELATDIAPGIPFPFSFTARNFKTNQVELLMSTEVLCLEQFDNLTMLGN